MQTFEVTPGSLLRGMWGHRALLRALTVREVVARYRGSSLGLLWSIFNPVLMMAIYTFVFSFVFKARWQPTSDSKGEFALALFVGLIAFNLFAECIVRAPGLILNNANYVKKVIFPLEVLPVVTVGAALFQACISLAVWLVFYVPLFGLPAATVLWAPLVLLPLLLLVLGVSWALAALGVYLRDIGQMMGLFTTALMFLSPVFYPSSALPERLRVLFQLNPLTPVIESLRDVLMWGRQPSLQAVLQSLVVGVVAMCLGYAFFQKTRKGFADVV